MVPQMKHSRGVCKFWKRVSDFSAWHWPTAQRFQNYPRQPISNSIQLHSLNYSLSNIRTPIIKYYIFFLSNFEGAFLFIVYLKP